MAIFVDRLTNWGWVMRGRKVQSCHMFTDSVDLEELHLFALRIGMRRAWFQPHRIAPHYDLTPSRARAAVQLGAIEVDRRQASDIWKARRQACANREIQPHELEACEHIKIRQTKRSEP